MKTWKVKAFTTGNVSDDGTVVSVKAVMQDGHETILEMPFSQLDWVTQALFSLGNGAFERQVQSGRLQAANPIDAAMTVAATRVLPNTQQQHALVQITGHYDPKAPVGMGSFLVSAEQAQSLESPIGDP